MNQCPQCHQVITKNPAETFQRLAEAAVKFAKPRSDTERAEPFIEELRTAAFEFVESMGWRRVEDLY